MQKASSNSKQRYYVPIIVCNSMGGTQLWYVTFVG